MPENDDFCLIPNPIKCSFTYCSNLTKYGLLAVKSDVDIMVIPICGEHLLLLERSKRGFGKCPKCNKLITVSDIKNTVNIFKYRSNDSLCWSCKLKQPPNKKYQEVNRLSNNSPFNSLQIRRFVVIQLADNIK